MPPPGPERALRVAIDVSALALTRAGSARYLNALLGELERRTDVDVVPIGLGGSGRAAKVGRDLAWYPGVLPRLARRAGADLLHCPVGRGPLTDAVPFVVTVHDAAVLRHPRAFNTWTRELSARTLGRIVRAARLVLTVSEFARDELVDLLALPGDRVRAIPNGVGAPFGPAGPGATGRFVLAVSTLEPRKNLTRVVEAFERTGVPGTGLVIAGAAGWGGVRPRQSDRVRWVGAPQDDELAALYRGAACVVYGSTYEGFGLPVLEAMACGAPVVCASGPPYDEFAAGVAVTVDPLDRDDIARGICEAIDRRAELGALGVARAAGFGWDRCADLTVQAYRDAVAPA